MEKKEVKIQIINKLASAKKNPWKTNTLRAVKSPSHLEYLLQTLIESNCHSQFHCTEDFSWGYLLCMHFFDLTLILIYFYCQTRKAPVIKIHPRKLPQHSLVRRRSPSNLTFQLFCGINVKQKTRSYEATKRKTS